MINLLPYEHKADIRAGRTNVILVRYISILVVAAIILGGLVVGSYIVLNSTKANAQQKEAENTARLTEFQQIQTDANAFRTDLATAKTVLDSSVSFSKLIYAIADTIPSGVILEDLSLNPSSFASSVTLNASAKTFSDGTKLRDQLAARSQLFTSVQLQSIRSTEGASKDSYPVKVVLSVVINKGAAQ